MTPGEYIIAVVLSGIAALIALTSTCAFFQRKKWIEMVFNLTMGVGFFYVLWQLSFNTL